MPLYEYRCDDCGVRFERRQKFSDEPITVCPECSGSVHRVIGPTGIIFKGSGFYVTDNRKRGGRTSTSSTNNKNETSGDDKLKGEAKSESKSSSDEK